MKKPIYKFAIFSKANKKLVRIDKKLLLFEFPKQAENYIIRRLGDLRNFDIVDIKKVKNDNR